MLSVKYANNEDGGELKSGFNSIEEAKEFIKESFCNGDVDEGDILQFLMDGEVKVEYTAEDFDC